MTGEPPICTMWPRGTPPHWPCTPLTEAPLRTVPVSTVPTGISWGRTAAAWGWAAAMSLFGPPPITAAGAEVPFDKTGVDSVGLAESDGAAAPAPALSGAAWGAGRPLPAGEALALAAPSPLPPAEFCSAEGAVAAGALAADLAATAANDSGIGAAAVAGSTSDMVSCVGIVSGESFVVSTNDSSMESNSIQTVAQKDTRERKTGTTCVFWTFSDGYRRIPLLHASTTEWGVRYRGYEGNRINRDGRFQAMKEVMAYPSWLPVCVGSFSSGVCWREEKIRAIRGGKTAAGRVGSGGPASTNFLARVVRSNRRVFTLLLVRSFRRFGWLADSFEASEST